MEWRRPVKPTAVEDRVKFVWMWVEGMSLRAIARETGASVTTVYRWVHRWQQEGNVNTKPRGHKPLVTHRDLDLANIPEVMHQSSTTSLDYTSLQCYHKPDKVPYYRDLMEMVEHYYPSSYMDYLTLLAKIHKLRSTFEYLNNQFIDKYRNLVPINRVPRVHTICATDLDQ
ncbi:putative Glutamate receptor-like 74 [Homarus americanus]|nr:putative Glutamate receptor-like 74 [Homarus americanus]